MSEPRRFRTGDLPELVSWCEARQIRAVEEGELPQIGFIAPGLAAGFLYLTDANVAFVGGLLANPAAPTLARARAASEIVDRLTEEAKACGFKYVAATCALGSTKKLSLKKGFVCEGSYSMLFKEV